MWELFEIIETVVGFVFDALTEIVFERALFRVCEQNRKDSIQTLFSKTGVIDTGDSSRVSAPAVNYISPMPK
jgi:hypothetical protein